MKTDIAYIYALIDPRDDSIRYIGKTINPKYRRSGHITECKRSDDNYRLNWIRSLLSKGLKPKFKILKICPLSEFIEYESLYIKIHQGPLLTNSDESGQGNINRKREIIDKYLPKISKKVYQFNLDGEFIQEWKSTREASRNLNISHANISRCCNGINRHVSVYIFRYDKDSKIIPIKNPNAQKKNVIEIDKYGIEIKRWNCLMDCSRDTKIDNGNLSRVCNGIIKSIHKRYFIFD